MARVGAGFESKGWRQTEAMHSQDRHGHDKYRENAETLPPSLAMAGPCRRGAGAVFWHGDLDGRIS